MYEITSGVVSSAQKVVIYGPEGIGKSTFAAQFLITIAATSARSFKVKTRPS
jgi:KaiC/GvpD/RAD55 family RecA-like ATPase